MRPPGRLDAIDEADESRTLARVRAADAVVKDRQAQRGGLGLDFPADFGGCSWVLRRQCYRLPLRRSVRAPWRRSGPSVRSVLAGLPSRRCVAAQCVDRFSCRARGARDQPTASRLMSPDLVDDRFADLHANGRAELKSAAVPAI